MWMLQVGLSACLLVVTCIIRCMVKNVWYEDSSYSVFFQWNRFFYLYMGIILILILQRFLIFLCNWSRCFIILLRLGDCFVHIGLDFILTPYTTLTLSKSWHYDDRHNLYWKTHQTRAFTEHAENFFHRETYKG